MKQSYALHRAISVAIFASLTLLGCAQMKVDSRTEISLPDRSYPEGITVDAAGWLYIGSLTSGSIMKMVPGSQAATLLKAGSGNLVSPLGLGLDASRQWLWVCSGDLGVGPADLKSPSALKAFALADGSLQVDATLPGGGLCNDITMLPGGDLLVTDSFNPRIMVLRAGSGILREWVRDARFTGGAGPGLNGIAAMPDGSVMVNHYSAGKLFRVLSTTVDGQTTAHDVVEVHLPRPLAQPDGMKRLADGRLVVVEQDTAGGNGRITELQITGSTTALKEWAAGLDSPTAIVEFNGRLYFVEGRYRSLFVDKSRVPAPFVVRSLAIPPR